MLAADRVAGGELRAERLVLAPLTPVHAPALYPLINDWDIARMLTRVEWPMTPESVQAFAAKKAADSGEDIFAILVGGAPIGVAGVKHPGTGDPPRKMPRLGYWIGRPYWGRGYGSEAVVAITTFAFARFPQAEVIGGGVFEDNPASRRVLEKAGFREARRYETHSTSRGGLVRTVDMHLARADWAAVLARAAGGA